MSDRVAELQCEDGFWRTSMLDIETYPDPETSSTGLFVYALAYGINQGYLPKDKFLPVVTKGWEALVASSRYRGKSLLGTTGRTSSEENRKKNDAGVWDRRFSDGCL